MIRILLLLLFIINPALAMDYKQQAKINRKLIEAVRSNRYDQAKAAIAAGAQVDTAFADWDVNQSMLHLAAQIGSTELCSLLIEHGASPHAMDRHKRTPLHYAAHCGNDENCALLIKHGAKADAADKEKVTPLYLALVTTIESWFQYQVHQHGKKSIESKFRKTCKILLEHGADVDVKTIYPRLPLSYAAESSDRLCELLLRYNPSRATKNIQHALSKAAFMHQERRCRLIIDYLTHFKSTIKTTLLCLNRMKKSSLIAGELYRHFRVLLLPYLDHPLPPLSVLAEKTACRKYVRSLKYPAHNTQTNLVQDNSLLYSWCTYQ